MSVGAAPGAARSRAGAPSVRAPSVSVRAVSVRAASARAAVAWSVALATTVGAFAGAAPAGARVTVAPDAGPAGSSVVLEVRVPNDRGDRGTVGVVVRMPPGVSSAAYEPVPDWTASVTTRVPARPFSVGGVPVRREVDAITWTGRGRAGVIAPGQFRAFRAALRLPDGAAGTTVPFGVRQTDERGAVVRWIGPAGSARPAPTVTLTGADGGTSGGDTDRGTAERGSAPAPVTPAAPSSAPGAAGAGRDAGGDLLPILLGAAGLLTGLAGLGLAVAGRRRVG